MTKTEHMIKTEQEFWDSISSKSEEEAYAIIKQTPENTRVYVNIPADGIIKLARNDGSWIPTREEVDALSTFVEGLAKLYD